MMNMMIDHNSIIVHINQGFYGSYSSQWWDFAPHFVLQERGKHHLAMIEVIRVAWILVVNLLGLAIFFDWIGTKWREQWDINWWISVITGISSHHLESISGEP